MAIIIVISAFAVYAAYIDRTQYKTEKLIIIPDNVTSDSWAGLNSVLVQDISEYSLYGDFTTDNSAYISELGLYSRTKDADEINPEPAPVDATGSDATTTPTTSSTTTEDTQTSPQPKPASNADTPSETPVPADAPEPASTPAPESEPVTSRLDKNINWSWGVLRSAVAYPLAQAIIEETQAGDPASAPDESTIDNEVLVSTPDPVETDTAGEENSTPDTVNDTGTSESVTGTSTPAPSTEASDQGGATETVEVVAEETRLGDFSLAPCEVADGCTSHDMVFSGFILPDFESGTVLDSVQLRLSLAAQTKASRGNSPQRYLVEYTYDTGSTTKTWDTASVIDIDKEISNSINGGYFLISFDTPTTADAIANLQVRISYQGNVAELDRAYVEGVWLEVTSGTFYEEGAADPYSDTLGYNRDLLQPHLNSLDNGDIDPTLGTLPSFTLSYDPQQNFLSRALRSLWSVNTFAVNTISLTDSEGLVIPVPVDVVYHDNHTWTLEVLKQPQSLRPGKYTITATMLENGVSYEDSFEFYWGVLAINTKKSMYFPNEKIELNLAALTADGTTICDADLHLKIVDPKNNIFEVPVTQSGSCGPNNVTDIPDYIAEFTQTGEWGVYTLQLENRNKSGQVVHKIQDSFEVRDYIPFSIERTAPTRIYPPAPYTVDLNITAYRDFTGDINERVPRGFVMNSIEGATISTLPEYTLITWKDVTLLAGDKLRLSYVFDAPDVSPYLYLLGPLDMDGFSELRQWQIASDALNNIGWFTGTRTVAGTNLNNSASPMQWSTSSMDNFYYIHSTSSNSQRVTLRQAGDYLVSVNLPQQRADTNVSRTRAGIEVRKNGVAVPEGLGRSGFITGGTGAIHTESSSNVSFMLADANANDYIEVFIENLDTIDVGDTINVTGLASMYLEYLKPTDTVFAATTTRTVSSTDLNQVAASALQWIETRQDSGFVHSNTVTPQNITLSATGTYMVHINIPITGVGQTVQQNISGRVLLDGVAVSGGHFQQGYFDTAANESEGDASIHWSGVVVSTTTNQVLTVTTARETAGTATTTVTPGFVGSIFVQKLPTTGVIALRGRDLVGAPGNNWNSTNASSTRFDTRLAYDSTVFTHSTTTNNHQITVNQSGDYILNFTDAVTAPVTQSQNNRITVTVGSTTITGAQSKSNFVRAQNAATDASTNLVFLLAGVTAGQVVTINTQQEAAAGTLSSSTDAIILLWKKIALDFRSPAPTMFNTPFDNARFASTTPYFDFQSNDPDGSSDIQYEFSISTTSDFATATIKISGIDAGFSNTATSSDTSPFFENNRIRFQLQAGDALSDLNTYYWRVRARDVSGSGEYGDYSTTQSLSIDAGDVVPNWYQTTGGQFQTNTLQGLTINNTSNNVHVDSDVSSEIMIAYGDSTSATPKFRLWGGTSWGIEQSAVAVGGTINWVRTAAGVGRDEYVLVTLDQSNSSYAQIYNATATAWGNRILLASAVANITRRGIAVGYESVSGDAMVVSCDATKNPVYRIWNGATWSATSTITSSLVNVCNHLEITSDPVSDEMILVIRDSGAAIGNNYEALVWNGSAWGNSRVFGSVQNTQELRAGIGLKYETSGDQAMVAVTNGTGNNFIYTTWTGTSWTSNTTQGIQNDFEFGSLTNDPDSDKLTLCYVNDTPRVGAIRWDGGIWNTFTDLTTTANSQAGRPVDCEFETVAGRSGNILAVYSDTTNLRYQTFATSTWSGQQTVTGVGAATGVFWVQTERAGDGTIVSVSHDDAVAGDEIESTYWNGTTWSTRQSIVPNPSSIIGSPYETFEMAAKRYQFTQGVVTTQPITFTAVANQVTWGDLTFSTTEPFGTDVTVKLKYSSTTTCDSYISNAALPGNGTGFDTTLSPINLTSLSTSTYGQICLEATLTTFGAASASLDDWSLAWVRKPKLQQQSFRWYGNGSYLTPTDPWPLGVAEVLENTALTSSESVNINDVIRLRLSLESANVSLPTTTAAFKLQYAAGLSCSAATGWADVGSTSSSTALWRGYANSIVGSDWLSASWTKRQKISIKKSMVSGAQIDFPVYVNLADLPATFFAGVRSDGADIRVTTTDGITEVPFELVSINTGSKIGELHFKATLATSTDTDFYIYYGNSAGSAYAANATYGSRNVWTNNFVGVYHFLQDPTGSAPQVFDSTANLRHASRTGTAGAGLVVDAKLGKGLDFVGTASDYTIYFPSFGLGSTSSFTYSAWLRSSTTVNGAVGDSAGTYMADRTTSTNELVGLKAVGGNYAHQYRYNDGTGLGSLSGGVITGSAWQQVVWGRSYNANRFIVVNNVLATTTDVATALTPPLLRFGGHQSNTNYTGVADEVRIASEARSTGWLTTEYNNQSNATGFYTLASEELIADGRFLPSTVLASSTFSETYEEQNPTASNRYGLSVGQRAEWDFVIQNNAAAANTNYCFRMVYADGSVLNSYINYPRLITNSPPPAPVLTAPFDNRQLASTSPSFEFAATDEVGDLVSYEVTVDNDYDFSSPAISRESNANFSQFTNLSAPSERGVYSSGQTIRFIPNVALTNGVTYWWRVRAKDDSGSGTYGPWSEPKSFTINTATTITTWFQTTGEQFNTNSLNDAVTSTSTNDVGINTSLLSATTTSTVIDYDNREVGNAWGSLSFTQNVTSGSIRHFVEYEVTTNTFVLVPDSVLAGNSSGFTSGPINLASLDTATHNVLRVTSVFSGTSVLPRLLDMTVTWSLKIEPPTLLSLFDNAKSVSTLPAFTFTTADPQLDDLQYEVQISTLVAFTSSSTFTSGINAGFSNVTTPADTSPFTSGQTIRYQTQTALTNGLTYWWRVRARDPAGSNSWSNYSTPKSFTVDTSVTTSVWHQTIGEQFATDENVDIETVAGGAQVTSVINGVMVAYGIGTGQAPQFRTWNGEVWSNVASADTVGAQIRWTRLKAATTRQEFALATLGTDLDVNIQIYNSISESWGDILKIFDNATDATKRRYDIAYENTSGKLMAVACVGNNAIYALWNGSTWTATSSISLANGNNCEFVTLANDPTSNEIIAVFRHTNTGTPDYEALVWNGSSWGNSTRFGDMNANTNEGIALEYEESGNQAVLVLPNGVSLSQQWKSWNGSTWSATNTLALGSYMTWGDIKRDNGSDNMTLCYIDNDADIGVVPWTGSGWNTFTEMTVTGNDNRGLPVGCEFQTTQGTDGDVVIAYSDTGAARYQSYETATGTYSGEFSLDVINRSWRMQTVRAGDGTIHMVAFDYGSAPDRYDTSRWNGTGWTTRENFSTTPSITGQPYDGSITIAPQIYPNFTTGSIRSTAINFADGGSPRWERVRFNDTTPGLSNVLYRIYYQSTPGVFSLVSDSALAGNSSGFTNSPIDISGLDKNIYSTLKLDAELICDSGNCPSVQDWSLEWSEGLIVSGTVLDYDQLTAVASGTIAVAVNGVLQVGKTAQVASGTTTQQMVFSTAGSSTFTVPSGVTNLTVKAWGAGGGGGASDATGGGGAGAGAGAGFVQGTITTIPSEILSVLVGGGGAGGSTATSTGAGGGGGYSGVMRTTTPLVVAGAGGGGGGGITGITFVAAGTACAVSGAACIPTVPAGTAINDVYIAVLNSRTNTIHTCTTNCAGWTEFSTQAGSAAEGRVSVWYYRQTGAAPANPTFAGPGTETYTGRIWAFRGVVSTGNPYDVLGTNTAVTVATTTFTGSNLSSTVPDALVVQVGGSMDDNTWGPSAGSCDVPDAVNATFYTQNAGGTDNSIFLCYKNKPKSSAGSLGAPRITQVLNSPDVGRYFTFTLKPQSAVVTMIGNGGIGGGLTGGTATTAGTSIGGGGGTQSVGGALGGGNATIGSAYTGGSGSTGVAGGIGGIGGLNGGGTGGTGASTTVLAGGAGGGAGYYGGGGGGSGATQYDVGAGGGGGSSYLVNSATATSTLSGSSTQAANQSDPDYSVGVGVGAAAVATTSGGSAGGTGRVVITWTTVAAPGTWSIPNVSAFTGDTVTVFMQNASGTDEAVGVTTYDGSGDISGMQLSKRHLTIGSNDVPTVTNTQLALYANGANEDIFYSAGGVNSINLCAEITCTDARLRVLSGSTYAPGTDTAVINFQNNGTFAPATSTFRISRVWQDLGVFTPSLSTVIFTATSSSYTPSNATSSLTFNNVTFGETSGVATWTVTKPLIAHGNLTINQGTLARGTQAVNIAGNLSLGTNGFMTGLSTTTFDGIGSNTWGDAKTLASSTNIGNVVVDGTTKTITLAGNVGVESLLIGSDDTLNSSGSGFNINVVNNWTNTNAFIPQSGTVTFVGTTTGTIARGTSAFNNLTFSGVGANWSFSTSTLALSGTLTIATGTVTLPTGTTTIGGNFTNSGGTFLHNNGEVRMTSTSAGRTITQRATTFLNAFYDLVFTGSGAWSYTESAATTTRNYLIQSGTVTMPTSTLTVSGDFDMTGSGAFVHNNGDIILLLQASNTVRANGSSFNNLRTRGSGVFTRTFSDTNTTVLGNLTFETGGVITLPTGTLSIGGSFNNTATFNNSSGTVRFNSAAGAETVAVGSSTFATLEFNSGTGDFTVIQNATATVAINLTSAQQFTLQSGLTLASLGSFSNAATASSTTWTGSTLSLSGPDGAINLKSHGGDAYATILMSGDTDMTMWNSTATTYSTASTSSIYSADHAGIDGDLNVYGDYVRTTGTEFWSFATDFDGAALTGSTSRQVDVRLASSTRVGFVSASLNLVGTAAASTTIDAISGTYGLSATNTTITASNFTVSGTNATGLALNASTTLSQFQDGFFTVVPGRSGMTISSTTVANNPSAQYQRIGFATTTAGAGTNVTLTGTTSAFVWFRSGTGNLYGENFDGGDANPGSIRFDDSSNSITISGIVYADDGVTPLGAPTCDGTTPNVRVVINNGSYKASTTCAAGTGAYTLTGVNYIGDPKVTVYLNTNGGVAGSVVTKTPSGDIANMHIFANRVITRHQDVTPLSIADMTSFDNDDDSDIKFTATTTGTTTLFVQAPNSLFVFATTTFAPGGNVTLFGNASTSAVEGTLQLGTGATFTATGTETHTLAGRLVLATTSVLTTASSTFVFNASSTGKSIQSPNTITLNNVQFTGVGGGWNITAPLIVNGNMDVATGTVTGTSNVTLTNGSLSGDGTLSFGSGTTTLNRTNTLGGTRAWTFDNLVLGSGVVVGTTTRASAATTTVIGRLTISPAHFLSTGSSNWDLAGTGSVFVEGGTLHEDTSTFRYSGAGAQVLSTTYYNLDINAGVGSPTYTAVGVGIGVTNNLTIGGTTASTFDINTNDPALIVGGSVLISSNGTLLASNLATTSVGSNWTNLGTFTSNIGVVAMVGSGSNTINAGNSSFATLVINNAAGLFTVAQNATATIALVLQNHTNFTLAPTQTFAIVGTFTNTLGGAATTFASSTLNFSGGGTKTINSKTTNDVYGTLVVASGTNVKMWNSSAATYLATGSIYSQDHGNVDGKLNIHGAYTQNASTDFWSYATDFDGTALGASPRKVDVAMASGSTAIFTGGGLEVVGTTTASTSVTNQGVGTYGLTIAGTASTTFDSVIVRDTGSAGIVFSGTPVVNNFSRTDHLVTLNGGTGVTVSGTVINANQAKNFTSNVFASSSGVTGATNVTATGTAISSWRFTNHAGALSGENFDNDPAGDPGYLVWDNSAALVTISGSVYSDEGSTVSTVCNGVTQNILLRVAGLTTYTASCNAGTGAYSIPNVAFSPADTLTVYIDNNIRKAATISADPVSSISNMDLYENRVIVRHENTSPLTIAKMAVWDSSDDGDILFTATDAGSDTLVLPADQKLLVWNGKTFEPNGNVTLSGGGGGGAQDGTLEAQGNATFRAIGTETHTIGGSIIFGTGATFTAGQSTTTFTTAGSGRTVDVNSNPFHNVAFTGSGSWNVTDTTFTSNRSLTQTSGTITFGSGTTTIGASLNATAGSFTMGGTALVFTSTSTGNIVRFDDSVVPSVRFAGSGGAWTMSDTNATSTGSFTVASGTVTLPTGNVAVAVNFENLGGTVTNNTADIIMTATSSANLRAGGSTLFAVRFVGPGPFTMTDVNLTLADSLTMSTGTLTLATGTLSVAGDFIIASGTVANVTGSVLFNATTVGKTVAFGSNSLYNVVFGSGTGGWNFLGNATTTNNFSITGASTWTKEANTTLNVGGVFTNGVGGANTTWASTTLRLYGTSGYTINTKTTGGDVYGTLEIVSPLAIRAWNSSAATTTVLGNASLYSQDHAAARGALNIYGTLSIATTTEYWNYATDFDGVALAGASQRQVNVRFASNATTTMQSGALQIIGTAATSTTMAALTGGSYALQVTGGTLNAQYYSSANLTASGLNLSGTPTITNLANGAYTLTTASGTLITVAASVLDANASKIFTGVSFATTSAITGFNVTLTGSTSNAWRFSGSTGNLSGEAFDVDGVTLCGSIRFDNSGCLLTQQTHYRWRNDDGGEGAPASEWFNTGFSNRQRVRVVNTDATAYASTAVKIAVTYDSSMQSDFDDLRFTSSDGVTPVPFWIERYTASTDATVWVQVPQLPASDIATVFMYYASSTASNASNGPGTFDAFDDFEDNNITEYSGDTSFFQTDTTPVYGGTYALEAASKSGRTTDGIFRTAMTVSQGQVIRWMQYLDSAGSGDDACTLFGVQSPGANNNNYAICLEKFGVDRLVIAKNVSDNDGSATVLASTTATYATVWYEVEVDWRTNNTITAYLRTAAGVPVAQVATTDSTYTTGGIGFTFWFQNGSWDSYTARPRALQTPTVYFGVKQTSGGATWERAQNIAGSGVTGATKRLRFAIENSGLDITSQTFRLEAAAKGASPSCEAVPTSNFSAVPNQSACGSSPICMQTSANLIDNDPTTDHLASTSGAFSAGKQIESPSNATVSYDLNQNKYTELEYVLTPTVNATTSYCLRVTNGGTPLDFYNKVAELSLQFDPVFGIVTLNSGNDITLTPGTTTIVYASSTVTDFNGAGDIVSASSTIYRSGAGPACVANTNNCYKSDTSASSSCSINNCLGNTCTVSCRADIYFNADATDIGAFYAGEKWSAYLEVRDAAGGYDLENALDQELITLQAAAVDSAINYGTLEVAANTGSYNPTTTVANIGNIAFNIELSGTDLSDGASSRIPANQQKFATSSFIYGSCVSCSVISSTTPVTLPIALTKPTAPNPPVTSPVYWGISVPIGVRSTAHSGTILFTPVSI